MKEIWHNSLPGAVKPAERGVGDHQKPLGVSELDAVTEDRAIPVVEDERAVRLRSDVRDTAIEGDLASQAQIDDIAYQDI